MKSNKLISLSLSVILILLMTPSVFAAEVSDVKADISYIKENAKNNTFFVSTIISEYEKELDNPQITQEEIDSIAKKISEYKDGLNNCINGKHTAWDFVGENERCVIEGHCLYCDEKVTVINQDFYAQHKDDNSDSICDDCNKEMPYMNCDHICHSDNIIFKKIIWPIIYRLYSLFGANQYCKCGMYHSHP